MFCPFYDYDMIMLSRPFFPTRNIFTTDDIYISLQESVYLRPIKKIYT